jgi:hypothetical protein
VMLGRDSRTWRGIEEVVGEAAVSTQMCRGRVAEADSA